MAYKKRKVDSECRLFKEEWAWKYFFTEYNCKPVCLICNEAVAVFKDFNLARHFNTKHSKTKYALMNDAEKKVNAENLKKPYLLNGMCLKSKTLLKRLLHWLDMLWLIK